MAVPRGLRLLPSVRFTLYGWFVINRGLESNLSEHAFYMQEIMAPVLNKDTVWFLLTLTGKLAGILTATEFNLYYFVLLR